MSRNKYLEIVKTGPKRWVVLIRTTKQSVATLYEQTGSDAFRFRLDNYPQNMSKCYKDMPSALAGIEKEVL